MQEIMQSNEKEIRMKGYDRKICKTCDMHLFQPCPTYLHIAQQ